MKKIINIILLSLVLLSCKKKIAEGTFTIKGHFYTDCGKIPISSRVLMLRNQYETSPRYETLATDTTDANGCFEFTLTNPPGGILFITSEMGIYPGYLNNLPFENIENLEVFSSNITSTVKVKLQATNNYTNNDTLFIIGAYSLGGNYKVAGPFYTGQELPLFNYSFFSDQMDYKQYYKKSTFSYKVGTMGIIKDTTLNVVPCTATTMTLEIK